MGVLDVSLSELIAQMDGSQSGRFKQSNFQNIETVYLSRWKTGGSTGYGR